MFEFLINVGVPLAGAGLKAVLVVAIGFGMNLFRKKTGLELNRAGLQLTRDVEQYAKDTAVRAVYAVEELAARQLKKSGAKWSSRLKHKNAVERVVKEVPKMTPERADELVTWAVGQALGLGATKALGATGAEIYPAEVSELLPVREAATAGEAGG